MLDPNKRQALVNLVGESVAERLISTMKAREDEATKAGITFKSITPPSAEDVLAILSNWKGSPMDTKEKAKGMDEDKATTKAEDETTTKAEDEMSSETETVEVSNDADMEDDTEESDEDISILSESDIMAIADAVANKITESMKAMTEELKGYTKTEKDATLATLAEAQANALQEMVKTIKEVNSRLESLETVAGKPYRPSQADNNVITQKEVNANKKALPAGLDPKYADAYMALMDMNFIR